ncbi:TRAP transporter substrate-binding protein [Chloroflexota bacterium]
MKNKILLLTFVVVIVTGLLIGGCTASTPEPTGPIIWKSANPSGPEHWDSRAQAWWASEVAAKTGGRLQIDNYFGGSSGIEDVDWLAAVRDGRIETNWVWAGPVTGEMESLGVQELPGFVSGSLELMEDTAEATMPEFAKQLENHNVILYYNGFGNPAVMHSTVPIRSLAEMKGKKVRSGGATESELTTLLGGTPLAVSPPETYIALQQGVADAAWFGPDAAAYAFKFYEVAKYMIDVPIGGSAAYFLVNKDAYNALPGDIQKILTDMIPAFRDKVFEERAADAATAVGKLESEGVEVITWSKEDMAKVSELAEAIWVTWYNGTSDADARKIYDLTDDYLKKVGAH